VVAVRKTLSLIKEVHSLFVVEIGTDFFTEGQMSNVEACVLSLLDPVSPDGALQVMSGPVPSILRFNNVELAIEAQSHYVMATVSTGTVHDNLVETIESHNAKQVTILNEGRIVVNFGGGTLLQVVLHGLFQELDVGVLHVLRHVGTNDWQVRVGANTSEESLCGVKSRLYQFNGTVAGLVNFDASKVHVGLSVGSGGLELQSVFARESKNFNVENLSVSKNKRFLAQGTCLFASRNMHIVGLIVNLLKGKIDSLKAL